MFGLFDTNNNSKYPSDITELNCTAPATFQRVIDTVLAGLKWQSCIVYLDDVVVFSHDFDEQLKHLRAVFWAIETAGLTLKPTKCWFARGKFKFLGHVVSNKGFCLDPEKTRPVAAFLPSSDKRAARIILDLCANYRALCGVPPSPLHH